MGQRWVCLDVGETLVDETRVFATWADVLEVPRFTLAAAIGGVVARGEDFTAAFALVGRPDWRDADDEVQDRYGGFAAADLYPDARPALSALQEAGYRVAVIANQPARRAAELRALGIAPPVMAMSESMGVRKPDPAFFATATVLMGMPDPACVAYVGDRVDNDVVPASAVGMRAVWLRRGPWAALQDDAGGAAALVVASLQELVDRVDEAFPP